MLHSAHHVLQQHTFRSLSAAPLRPGSLALAQASVNVPSPRRCVVNEVALPTVDRATPSQFPARQASCLGSQKETVLDALMQNQAAWSVRT